MAHLGSKTTDGRLSFVKYVTDNKRAGEIDFEIEQKTSTPLFTRSGSSVKASKVEYKAGTKLKILDKIFVEISKVKYAVVSIQNKKGLIPISKIRKPTAGNGTQYEDEVVDLINEVIIQNGGAIDIKIKGDSKVYKNILYALKVDTDIKRTGGMRGDPKADIILCQDKRKPIAPTSIYISHKKEGGPEAFQQYGGLSLTAGRVVNDHPIVQKFLGIVADSLNGTDKLPAPIMATFNDKSLMNSSIFGPDFGKAFSLNHTQIIGQGKPKLTNVSNGRHFELDFSSHMSKSGDLSHFKGGYLPVLGASYRAGRSFEYQGKRYAGARVGFYPQKLIANRSGTIVYAL